MKWPPLPSIAADQAASPSTVLGIVLKDGSRTDRLQRIFKSDVFFGHLFLRVLGNAQSFLIDLIDQALQHRLWIV